MKLASYRVNNEERYGLAIGERLVDLKPALAEAPASLQDLIEAGPDAWTAAQRAAEKIAADPGAFASHGASEVEWRAPVLRPSKIVCIAFNNAANADRIMRGPKHPALFTKPASALVGHRGAIECRPEYGRCHPEPELAFVIGKTAKNVRAEDALDHVFGYTIHNDITSPDMRGEDTFHYRAIHPKAAGAGHKEIEYVDSWTSYPGRYKSCDTFACLGPWIVTKDEIDNPHGLTVWCHHKGELVTEDNTENFTFKLPELLAFISRYMTLVPGDVVSMGTALKRSATGGAVQNIDLNRLGGPISIRIEKIGELVNSVKHLTD
jgi:2-keto-4-pentenoate hydratase/2-oxohepta-3-ene-1,7-dioic acid hydratase in catechol pathway